MLGCLQEPCFARRPQQMLVFVQVVLKARADNFSLCRRGSEISLVSLIIISLPDMLSYFRCILYLLDSKKETRNAQKCVPQFFKPHGQDCGRLLHFLHLERYYWLDAQISWIYIMNCATFFLDFWSHDNHSQKIIQFGNSPGKME